MVGADDERVLLAAIAYWAIIRARALTLPFTKSTRPVPSASAYSAATPWTARSMLNVTCPVGADELQRELGVVLVGLHGVGQTDGEERRVAAGVAHGLDGELARRPASDESWPPLMPSTRPCRAGVPQVRLEEADAALDLVGRVDLGPDVEVGDDRPLLVAHRRRIRAPPEATGARRAGYCRPRR